MTDPKSPRSSAIMLTLPLILTLFYSLPAYAGLGGWKFSWSDEFNGGVVDAGTWGFETGYVRNNEDQYYSQRLENSRTENGNLVISALRDNWSGHEYTSASRTTRNKKTFKYGRFELRAKIDIRAGSWPAWWWLPNSGGWPQGGEIDMMEFYQGKCLFNVMDGNQKWTAPTRSVASLGGAHWAQDYHVWTMEWDSTRIDLSLDGVLINHYPLADADGTGPNGVNPFRQAGYMILNQAIGGNNGGDPAGTGFPVDFQVDWLRVHAWSEESAYSLKVKNGTGSGPYIAGTLASLTANQPPEGQEFAGWVVEGVDPGLDSLSLPSATLSMPARDVSVTATFRSKGSGLGSQAHREPSNDFSPVPRYDLLGKAFQPVESKSSSIRLRTSFSKSERWFSK